MNARAREVFAPHHACTVASGDCFREGRCLDDCLKRHEGNCLQQIRGLKEYIVRLEGRIIAMERRQ